MSWASLVDDICECVHLIGLCRDCVGDVSERVFASDLPVDVTQLYCCYLRWLLGRCRLCIINGVHHRHVSGVTIGRLTHRGLVARWLRSVVDTHLILASRHYATMSQPSDRDPADVSMMYTIDDT